MGMDSGVLTVDGQSVLAQFGSYSIGGFATLTYNSVGNLPDAAAGVWSKHVVHMALPLGVQVTVFRWKNYIDLRIRMPRQPDQDGACGNWNGNPGDDSTVAIQGRVGVRVGPPARYAEAQKKCPGMLRGRHITNQNKACVMD